MVAAEILKEIATELYLGRASCRGNSRCPGPEAVTGWFLRSVLVWPSRVNERGLIQAGVFWSPTFCPK